MRTVVNKLNAIIDNNEAVALPSQNDCRLALLALENYALTVNAIRQILGERKNAGKTTSFTEALDHAERCVKLHDDYIAQVAARAHAEKLVATVPVVEEATDLV